MTARAPARAPNTAKVPSTETAFVLGGGGALGATRWASCSRWQGPDVYVLHGTTGCFETRRVLTAWFTDSATPRGSGQWFCFDSHGSALLAGQIEHCSALQALIADYDHRIRR